jgi:hypothetical protein
MKKLLLIITIILVSLISFQNVYADNYPLNIPIITGWEQVAFRVILITPDDFVETNGTATYYDPNGNSHRIDLQYAPYQKQIVLCGLPSVICNQYVWYGFPPTVNAQFHCGDYTMIYLEVRNNTYYDDQSHHWLVPCQIFLPAIMRCDFPFLCPQS